MVRFICWDVNEFLRIQRRGLMRRTYVGYKLAMSPYGIQFSDEEDKLTMEKLEFHDFKQGDKFVLYEDTEGKVCLKKDRD